MRRRSHVRSRDADAHGLTRFEEGEQGMRIAMISDVHGNLYAFDAVLADVDATGPYDEVVYGGDLVFNGAFPV